MKKSYQMPEVVRVPFDMEISLVLLSGNPGPPTPPFGLLEFDPGMDFIAPIETTIL